MPEYRLSVNDEQRTVEVDADTPLLWVLRDELRRASEDLHLV